MRPEVAPVPEEIANILTPGADKALAYIVLLLELRLSESDSPIGKNGNC